MEFKSTGYYKDVLAAGGRGHISCIFLKKLNADPKLLNRHGPILFSVV